MISSLSKEDLWLVAKKYFEEKGLVRQHLDSYNRFIREILPQIIEEFSVVPITDTIKLYIEKPRIGKPQWIDIDGTANYKTPLECRIRNLTYMSPLYVTIRIEGDGFYREMDLKLMDLPVMLKSEIDMLSTATPQELVEHGEDPQDPGGYFIINGSEKVLVAQEDLASNTILLDYGQEGTGITHTAKVISAAKGRRSQLIVDRRRDGLFYANVQGHRIPVVVLMVALGLDTKEILYAVSPDPTYHEFILPSILQAEQLFPRLEIPQNLPEERIREYIEKYRRKIAEEALDYIGSRFAVGRPREERIQRAQRVLDERLLPHIGIDSTKET
ncbi:MAG: DNA-directed RNA polymerase subunit B, partial [Desulfurococcaceae archaeon]